MRPTQEAEGGGAWVSLLTRALIPLRKLEPWGSSLRKGLSLSMIVPVGSDEQYQKGRPYSDLAQRGGSLGDTVLCACVQMCHLLVHGNAPEWMALQPGVFAHKLCSRDRRS